MSNIIGQKFRTLGLVVLEKSVVKHEVDVRETWKKRKGLQPVGSPLEAKYKISEPCNA